MSFVPPSAEVAVDWVFVDDFQGGDVTLDISDDADDPCPTCGGSRGKTLRIDMGGRSYTRFFCGPCAPKAFLNL